MKAYLIAMAHINIWDLPSSSKNPPRFKEGENYLLQQPYSSNPSIKFLKKNYEKDYKAKSKAHSHLPSVAESTKTKIHVELENTRPRTIPYSTIEKGKHRATGNIGTIVEDSLLDTRDYQTDKITWDLPSISRDPNAESRREVFRKKLAKAAFAESIALGENKKNGDLFVQEILIKTWAIDPPTSARSSGTLDLDAGIWRDFAYRDPWPELPGTTPLLSPDGFGKFFPESWNSSQESSLSSPVLNIGKEEINPQLKCGELKRGNEIFSDPRTENKVDRWLQSYSKNISESNQQHADRAQKLLLKQIFQDSEEVKLLRDILGLVDFERILRKSELRHNSAKNFIKFYRKNAEIVLSRFSNRIKYKENFIPSLNELQSFKRWRVECAPWRAHYNIEDILDLQPLQRDINTLARSYFNIQVQEDPETRFMPIYRAFYQLELYCQLFRISKFATPETSGDRLEKMKRCFFERYMPYETSQIFKISRWFLREWFVIDKLCDSNVRDKVRKKLSGERYNAYHRNLGIKFFAELLYSDSEKQTALMDKNRWQLNMIKFAWRTTCWAAQDEDEKGNVILIEDQELIEQNNDVETRKRLFGSAFSPWSRLPM